MIMEKITKYYNFDYENDTTIEYVNAGSYSMLNCSYTSEDSDYGTDTLHYTADPAVSMEQMAYELFGNLVVYNNKRDQGRTADITREEQVAYGGYSNSTLYAVEHALKDISVGYKAPSWFGHLEDVCREIAKRIIKDGDKKFSFCESDQLEWDSYSPEEYGQMGAEWYGIKRLESIFDNASYEYIVGVGYYGGGCFESAYVYEDGLDQNEAICYLGRAICNAIMKMTDMKEQSIIYATEEKEEK